MCRRTPRRRASSAASVISPRVTENGEQGASAIRTIAPGAGSWKRLIAASLAARIASRSSTTSSGGSPPSELPEIHRAAAGVEAQADGRGGADLDLEEVPGVAREDVVVVGGRRAARARERRQAGARRCPARLGVDQRPHRVELDQPLEQRRLLSESAGGPLVEVVVAVDEAGRRQVAAAVDPAGSGPPTPVRRGPLADGDDPLALDHEVPVAVLGPGRVDRRDRAALDDGAHRHVCDASAMRSPASRTASRIFS